MEIFVGNKDRMSPRLGEKRLHCAVNVSLREDQSLYSIKWLRSLACDKLSSRAMLTHRRRVAGILKLKVFFVCGIVTGSVTAPVDVTGLAVAPVPERAVEAEIIVPDDQLGGFSDIDQVIEFLLGVSLELGIFGGNGDGFEEEFHGVLFKESKNLVGVHLLAHEFKDG